MWDCTMSDASEARTPATRLLCESDCGAMCVDRRTISLLSVWNVQSAAAVESVGWLWGVSRRSSQ